MYIRADGLSVTVTRLSRRQREELRWAAADNAEWLGYQPSEWDRLRNEEGDPLAADIRMALAPHQFER